MSSPADSAIFNEPAPGLSYFTPAQYPVAGTASDPQPNGKSIPKLFQPIKIRGVEFHNRIFVAPMCQYSADDGHVTEWHKAHLGGIFTRGPGLSLIEATAVLPEGRISPEDTGIWADSHIGPLKEIVDFAHSQGQKIGIQLAHAGRKASTTASWFDALAVPEKFGGWPDNVWGPTNEPYNDKFPVPKALTKEGIQRIVDAFVAATKRAEEAGFDVVEIHNAHGFLLSSFVSPSVNTRTDEYGGSFENRIRLTLEVVDAVRAAWPADKPLFLRITATEWLEKVLPNEPSWRVEDTVRLAHILADRGVDFLDISSGGNHQKQKIVSTPGAYQAPFAEAVKKSVGDKLLVGAVGGINTGHIAQEVLDKNQADVVLVGRYFQKNPGLVWQFADDLGVEVSAAHQIEWGFRGRGTAKQPKTKP